MRGTQFRPSPLALALFVATLVLSWAMPSPAQSRDPHWRVQDYEESEESDESEGYDEADGQDDSDEYEDVDEVDEPDEYEDADEDDSEEESVDMADDDESLDDEDEPAEDESEDYDEVQEESSEDEAAEYEDPGSSVDGDEYVEADDGEYADDDVGDEYFYDELEDDSWAPPVAYDETNDALQARTDDQGRAEVFEVVESVVAADRNEDVAMEIYADGTGAGDMPVVQPVVSKPGRVRPTAKPKSPGAKPSTAGKPAASTSGKPRLKSSFGGKPVARTGVPWQAQIYAPFPAKTWPADKRAGKALWQLQHYCGGILIASDWVLTAAHCIDQEMVDSGYRIRLGSRDIASDDGWTYKIDRIVRHSRYADESLPSNPNRYANDIALIHIVEDGKSRPRDPKLIQVIPLYRGRTLAGGTEVTGTGWGLTKSAEGALPNAVLLKVDLRVMDEAKCRGLQGYGAAKIGEGVFCAANPARSTCRGDSGGPVILTNGKPIVVGIVSWGKKRCSGDGHPGVYTRISSYLPWIDKAMKLPPGKNSLP